MFKVSSQFKKRSGILEIDDVKFTVAYGSRVSRELTSVEFRILACFARVPGGALKKRDLMTNIWGDTIVHAKTINVHFSHLRRKLKEIGVDIVHEGQSSFRVSPVARIEDEVEVRLGAS